MPPELFMMDVWKRILLEQHTLCNFVFRRIRGTKKNVIAKTYFLSCHMSRCYVLLFLVCFSVVKTPQ